MIKDHSAAHYVSYNKAGIAGQSEIKFLTNELWLATTDKGN